MAYKNYSYIEKELELLLKFSDREERILFQEPTLYSLLKSEKLVEQNKFEQALKILGVEMKSETFISNPLGILKGLFEVSYRGLKGDDSDDGDGDESFLPSVLDIVSKRYGIIPNELIKKVTPTQLKSIFAGIEFNMNVEADKKGENFKFKEKEVISEEKMEKYDDIMKRVNEAKLKRESN